MGGKIWFIIVIVIALGIGLYIYSSGAFVNGLKSFNALIGTSSTFSFFNIGSSSIAHGPSAPIGPPPPAGTTIGSPSSGNGANAVNPADIPAGFTAAQLSPYFHEVLFGSVSPATFYSYGTIALDAYFNTTSTIDVTGWQIRSTIGDEYVPQAVNVYDPTGFAPASDIEIRNGDTVYLYSSSAPFNLRLNECTGYMAHVANFVPALPATCPYTDRSQIQGLSGACQNYILTTIGQCQMPDFSSPQLPNADYACMNYLEDNFTYRSCFDQHSGDPNFLSDQVWVWTGDNVVGQYHDTIQLLDRNGLLVDLYTY